MNIEIRDTADPALEHRIRQRWNSLTKPPGSLGRLESLVLEYALMRGVERPRIDRKVMALFCADHGVTEEGVSAFPREVTAQMVRNFLRGGAAISVLCRRLGIETVVVDAGVDGPVEPGALDYKCGQGTANFARQPALTRAQAEQALRNGISLAGVLSQKADIAAVGEMGIGNTTSASALLCALTGCPPDDAAGAGTGLDSAGISRKASVIAGALRLHDAAVKSKDPLSILGAFGGFEIATMAGFFLGAASRRLPVMVDGFICCAAALVARAFEPSVMRYLIVGHRSAEGAHDRMLAALQRKPLLDLEMRLGEGTGAALAVSILENALALYSEMSTFDEIGVSKRL
ncbi:MAG TPA: nicotinate-nucleotide--dimethylbenzimidazole phosphoribosyltransferase [Bryobacteraceae bacterium]|nr:nicotinate-nucleotide--dimethylbenzimidazole phosphoribosyltransferase [Bryobacteraceae bacterium]